MMQLPTDLDLVSVMYEGPAARRSNPGVASVSEVGTAFSRRALSLYSAAAWLYMVNFLGAQAF